MIRYYTAAEIATAYRRPIGTVHRLASVHGWRRTQDGRRPVLYLIEDVEKTFDRAAEARRLDAVACGEASSDQGGALRPAAA